MANVRSPNYPSMTLSESIEAVRPVFAEENRNKMAKTVLAKHLGYNGLNGRALSKIGAVRAYGLIEGGGDELKISDDAVILLNAPNGAAERHDALTRCAFRPALFKELQEDFPATGPLPSETNVAYELVKSRFTQDAAVKAAKTYLDAMRLVRGLAGGYNGGDSGKEGSQTPPKPAVEDPSVEVGDLVQVEIGGALQLPKAKRVRAVQPHEGQMFVFIEGSKTGVPMAQVVLEQKGTGKIKGTVPPPVLDEEPSAPPKPGLRKEVFALDEGDVALSYPENMSSESYEELEAYLRIFLRKAKRRAERHQESRQDLIERTIVDVSHFEEVEPGVYALPSFDENFDYRDLRKRAAVWSIGRNKKTGEYRASLDDRFYKPGDAEAEYECVWLR